MKVNYIPYYFSLLLLSGCTSKSSEDVVCETYVHRYGVELDSNDWSSRGQDGQVVSTMKDGCVVARNYEGGVLHGETTYSYPHRSTIQKKEVYTKGALTEESWNYSNGIPSKQVTHNSPTSQSHVVWYDNGVPQSKEQYENNTLSQGEYYTPLNAQESSVNNGNGMRTRRDAYGALQSVDEIQNGQMTVRNTFHSNGNPEAITPYENDVVHGERKTFLPGGEPNTVETWNKGIQHGPTTVFENGERYANVPYVNGVKHGVENRFKEDGITPAEDINWVKGARHGPSYGYIGNTIKTDWYFEDKQVNKATYDALSNQ